MKSLDMPVAAVVGLDINGLGLVRSLARAAIPTVAFDADLKKPTAATRYARKRIAALAGDGLIDALLAFRETQAAAPVLFLTQEQSVRTVSAQRDRLAGRFHLALPPHEVVHRLMNKDGFMPFAEAAGLAVPGTVTVRGPEDHQSLSRLRPPLIVKPSERTPEYAALFQKGYVVDSAEEAAILCERIAPVHREIMVQEWIPGGDGAIFFTLQYIAADGRLIGAFTGRKLVSWPPRVGGTAMCVAAPEAHEDLSAQTYRFFQKAGFWGMGGMEYKRDARSGRYYVIEPTISRTDYQSEVATLNGVNLPALAYHTEIASGKGPELAPKGACRAWRDPYTVGGRTPMPHRGRTETGAAWTAVDSLFRWSDPLPWIRLKLLPVTRRLRRTG